MTTPENKPHKNSTPAQQQFWLGRYTLEHLFPPEQRDIPLFTQPQEERNGQLGRYVMARHVGSSLIGDGADQRMVHAYTSVEYQLTFLTGIMKPQDMEVTHQAIRSSGAGDELLDPAVAAQAADNFIVVPTALLINASSID